MANIKNLAIVGTAALFLAACTATGGGVTYSPVVDLKGVNTTQYQADLFECQQLAAQRGSPAGDAATGVAGGALLGAAAGGLIGAMTGAPGRGAAYGAASGGLAGGVHQGASGVSEQKGIVRSCLSYRGYRVVGS